MSRKSEIHTRKRLVSLSPFSDKLCVMSWTCVKHAGGSHSSSSDFCISGTFSVLGMSLTTDVQPQDVYDYYKSVKYIEPVNVRCSGARPVYICKKVSLHVLEDLHHQIVTDNIL